MSNDQSNCQMPDYTTIQRMSISDGKMYTSALDLPKEEFEKLIQQYSSGSCDERQYIPFTEEDIANLARDNEEFFAQGTIKTEGFEKVVVFLMSLTKQIWQATQKNKSFRMELFYDAETLNTNYFLFTPVDKK